MTSQNESSGTHDSVGMPTDRRSFSSITVPEAVGLLKDYQPGEVAALIEACHIVGVRQDANSCAMARWFRQVTGERVQVDGLAVYRVSEDDDKHYALPKGVQEFVTAFDFLEYPHLVEGLA